MAVEVSGLYTYPIKSCAPVELEAARLTERGLAYDREWMVVNQNNVFQTQRVKAELSLVHTGFLDGSLVVTAPGHGELRLPLNAAHDSGEEVEVDVFKKRGSGRDQGEAASEFFSDYLGRRARLLRILRAREIKPETQVTGASKNMGFADGFPLTLASTSSLAELNRHMVTPIGLDRFRPNIVVSGSELPPYDEDYWRVVQLGKLRAYVVRACARCPVPNIDQQAGVLPKPKDRLVSQALRQTRRGLDPLKGTEEDFFMQNLTYVFEDGVSLGIGDKVRIVERAAEPNFTPLATSAPSLSELLPQQERRQRHPVSE